MTEQDLMRWQRSWANYHVLMAMAELGVFDAIGDGKHYTAEQLEKKLGADPRAIDICARILVKEGLMCQSKGEFWLSSAARELAEPLAELKRQWRHRAEYEAVFDVIKSGHPAISTSGGVDQEDENDAREFLRSMYRQSEANASVALQVVKRALAESGKTDHPSILDLGGGHGRYAETFAAGIAGACVTMFDRPIAAKIAPELAGTGFKSVGGDFMKDDLGGPYDLIFMAFIVSGIAIEDVDQLMGKLYRSLNPCGRLIIGDIFIDPEANSPEFAVDFNLVLLLENEHGRFRNIPQLCTLLEKNDFNDCKRVAVAGQDMAFLVAQKNNCACGTITL